MREFRHDGSEIIFSLPNGLQAYMIVRADGSRADKAPVANVWNKRAADGPIENLAAISCLSCHARGPIEPTDEVRATASGEKDEAVAARVRSLYVEKDEWKRLVDEDRSRQRKALELAGARLGEDGSALVTLSRRYEEPVSLKVAAAELGVDEGSLRPRIVSLIDLAPLTRGRKVSRAAFAKGFAAAAQALGLGRCLEHREPASLVLPPPRPGLARFESPVGDRVLSLEVDSTWKLATRIGGLVLSHEKMRAKMRFSVEDNDASDTDDAIMRERVTRPRARLVDHADDPEPSVERYFVEQYPGPDGTVRLDWATLKGTRTNPKTGRLYRLSCELPGPVSAETQREVCRVFKRARIARGAEASPDDPFHTDLPPALAAAGFETDWDKALARAKAEGKLVLCFVKPAPFWFT
ncbi:hypothetical protein HY251_02235 [bacterium]|nr:hypothetical protein [bacterium]